MTTAKDIAKKFTPKKALYLFSIVFMAALVSLMTFANWIIDPDHFNFWKWLTDTLIFVGIQIPSIILGELICKDRQETNPRGKYQFEINRFNDTEDGIIRDENGGVLRKVKGFKEEKNYFSQYFFDYRNSENHRKKVDYLMGNEMDGRVAERLVTYYSYEDLDDLTKRVCYKTDENGERIPDSIVKPLRPEFVPFVRDVFEGKVNIKENSPAYYLSVDTDKNAADSVLEEGPRIERENKRMVTRNRVVKILSHVFFSGVFSMMVIDTASDPGSLQTWVNFVGRITAMVAGITSGWVTSVESVKMEASVIEKKCFVREGFILAIADGTFSPKTYEQEAEEALAKQEEEDKKAVESVAAPEVVINDTKLIGGNV